MNFGAGVWRRKTQPFLRRAGEALQFSSIVMPDRVSDGADTHDFLRRRMRVLLGLAACFYVLLPLRTIYLGIVRPSPNSGGGGGVEAVRADIRDRNGMVLATRVSGADLIAEPPRLIDAGQAAAALHRVFPELKTEVLLRKLGDPEHRYVVVKRDVPPQQQQTFHDLGLPGFTFERRMHRFYPQGASAAHVIGYTDSDNNGIAGFEHTLDTLHPVGGDLSLTLDMNVQFAVYETLQAAVEKTHALGGIGVMMRAADGQVMSMVSLPDFDPNVRRFKTGDPARFNKALTGVYEMGSTFKIFNTAIALETGAVKLSDKFDVTGPYYVHGRPITDYEQHRGSLSVSDIFRKSSNIGSAKMAERFAPGVQQRYLKKLGLLDKLPFDLPETAAPLLPRQWGPVESLTIAYGYGLSVTPLQLISAVSTVVNGGLAVRPTLFLHPQTEYRERVFSPEVALTMRKLMRLVVEPGGTGKRADVAGYPVIGKTGTANKIRSGGKGYDGSSCMASFVGAFPYKQPEYVLLVMIDSAKIPGFTRKCATGGLVAAPVAHDIIARAAPLLGLPPEMSPVVNQETDLAIDTGSAAAGEDTDDAAPVR